MKKKSWLFIVILAVACNHDDVKDPGPIDPVAKPSKVTHLFGEYQTLLRRDCNNTPYCASLVKDSVVLVTEGKTDSTVSILGYDVYIDKDGNFYCCDNFDLTLRNDTLKTSKRFRNGSGFVGYVEQFIGVKGAKLPLKAGTVSFRKSASEVKENGLPIPLTIDIEGAKLGAAIVIEVLNLSNLKSNFPDGKSIYYMGINVTSLTMTLSVENDFLPYGPGTIQLRILDESAGVNVSENRTHTINIHEDDVEEPSVNKIMFTDNASRDGFYGTQLFDINSDGTGRRQRTDFPGSAFQPRFSPDGARVMFIRTVELLGTDTKYEIHTMNFNGLEERRITTNDWKGSSPLLSPQGDKILFLKSLRNYPVNTQIFTVNLDGSAETQISHIGNGVEAISIIDLSWSPDGKQVFFTCNLGNEGFGYRIYVMNADGSNVRRLTNKFRDEAHLRFSPDGQKIIFNTFGPDIGMNLYLMNADGSGEEKVFIGIPGLSSRDAEWAPDSQSVVFLGSFEPFGLQEFSTFTARIDGTDLKQISLLPLRDFCWSPAK